MTALATRSQIECNKCAAPLTGGLDTFGDWPRAFCFTCWHDTLTETAATQRNDFLRELMDKLENQSGDLENDIDDMQSDLRKLETRIGEIENELNGHGRCKEEEPKPK